MRKFSDALRELVEGNSFLSFGLSKGLLNMSQTARHLRPLVEARTKKKVQDSAVLMSLSRLTKQFKAVDALQEASIESLTLQTNLLIANYTKSAEVHKAVNLVYNRLQKAKSYFTVTEGTREITLIYGNKHHAMVHETIPGTPRHLAKDVAGLGISFSPDYIDKPGLYFTFFQQLYLQNISVVEVASTATELIIYLKQSDAQLGFETLYNKFGRLDG